MRCAHRHTSPSKISEASKLTYADVCCCRICASQTGIRCHRGFWKRRRTGSPHLRYAFSFLKYLTLLKKNIEFTLKFIQAEYLLYLHQNETARQVVSLLALQVQKYKYWHLRSQEYLRFKTSTEPLAGGFVTAASNSMYSNTFDSAGNRTLTSSLHGDSARDSEAPELPKEQEDGEKCDEVLVLLPSLLIEVY